MIESPSRLWSCNTAPKPILTPATTATPVRPGNVDARAQSASDRTSSQGALVGPATRSSAVTKSVSTRLPDNRNRA